MHACIGKLLPQSSDTYSRGPYANLSPVQRFEIRKKDSDTSILILVITMNHYLHTRHVLDIRTGALHVMYIKSMIT